MKQSQLDTPMQTKCNIEAQRAKGIILAAGQSKRLKPLIDDRPKCLLALNGETILSYLINSLFKCGAAEVIVVVGYRRDQIVDYIERMEWKTVRTVENTIYSETDNAHSVALALEYVNPQKDSCVILDGDIIFEISLLSELLNSNHENILAADNTTKIDVEDSKVLVEDCFVRAIGKDVNGNAIYTSLIRLGGRFLDRFKEEVQKPEYKETWYSKPLNTVFKSFPREVFALLTNGRLRLDIDTYSEYLEAKEIFKTINGAESSR